MAEELIQWFNYLPTDTMKFGVNGARNFLKKSSNLLLVEGEADGDERVKKALEIAKQEAISIAPDLDFLNGEKYMIQISNDLDNPLALDELLEAQTLFGESSEVVWGITRQKCNGRARIRVAAANLKKK